MTTRSLFCIRRRSSGRPDGQGNVYKLSSGKRLRVDTADVQWMEPADSTSEDTTICVDSDGESPLISRPRTAVISRLIRNGQYVQIPWSKPGLVKYVVLSDGDVRDTRVPVMIDSS